MRDISIPKMFYLFGGFCFIVGIVLLFLAFGTREMWSHYFIRDFGQAIIAFIIGVIFFAIGFFAKKLGNFFKSFFKDS